MFCTHCGNKLHENDLFCSRCGTAVVLPTGESGKTHGAAGLTGEARNSQRIIESFFRDVQKREATQAILDMEFAAIKGEDVDLASLDAAYHGREAAKQAFIDSIPLEPAAPVVEPVVEVQPEPIVEEKPEPIVEEKPASVVEEKPEAAPEKTTEEKLRELFTEEELQEVEKKFPHYRPTLSFDPPELDLYETIYKEQVEPETKIEVTAAAEPATKPEPKPEPAPQPQPTPQPTTDRAAADAMLSKAEDTAAELDKTFEQFTDQKKTIDAEAQATLDMMEQMFADFDKPLSESVSSSGLMSGSTFGASFTSAVTPRMDSAVVQNTSPDVTYIDAEMPSMTSEMMQAMAPEVLKNIPPARIPVKKEPGFGGSSTSTVSTDELAKSGEGIGTALGLGAASLKRFGDDDAATSTATSTMGVTAPDGASKTAAAIGQAAIGAGAARIEKEGGVKKKSNVLVLNPDFMSDDEKRQSGNPVTTPSPIHKEEEKPEEEPKKRGLFGRKKDKEETKETSKTKAPSELYYDDYEPSGGGVIKKILMGVFTALLAIAAAVSILVTFGRETTAGQAVLDMWDRIKGVESEEPAQQEGEPGTESETSGADQNADSNASANADANSDANANTDANTDANSNSNANASETTLESGFILSADKTSIANPNFNAAEGGLGESYRNSELMMEAGREYSVTDFYLSSIFADSEWYKDENGNPVTYNDALFLTITDYYTKLIERMNRDDSAVLDLIAPDTKLMTDVSGIKADAIVLHAITRLEVGETRKTNDNYYAIVSLNTATNDGKSPTTEKRLLRLVADNDTHEFKVAEIISAD